MDARLMEEQLMDLRMADRMPHVVMDFFESHPNLQKYSPFIQHDTGYEDEDEVDDFWQDGGLHYVNAMEYMAMYTASRKARLQVVQPTLSHDKLHHKLLEAQRQRKAKAEKKRLKKQRQKERRRLEKLEMQGGDPQRPKDEDSAKESDKSTKDDSSSRVKPLSAAKTQDSSSVSDSSSDEYSERESASGEEEELDLASSFVSKAALKIQQNCKAEREKKPAIKKSPQPVKAKSNEPQDTVEKNTHTPTFEDNIKRSTEFAVLGNTYASAGQFDIAVKYFTDAIKYNPTQYKLFGNRSFCFEKLQQYEKALTDAQLSLNMCPGWVKGLFRKGRALAGLKRYDDAGQAFKEVLKLDPSSTDAAQELMRVQITQLMEYGFSREESSNALIIHGAVNKALEVLSKLHCTPGAISISSTNSSPPPAQLHNVRASPLPPALPYPPLIDRPLVPVHSMSRHNINPAVRPYNNEPKQLPELFPIWVGNLVSSVTESMLTNVFRSAGKIHSVKHLSLRKCAFINFTCKEHCEEAIRRFHGYELEGANLAVRYPDRIPSDRCFSKAANKADHLKAEFSRQKENPYWKN